MFCPSCGKQNQDNVLFCKNCGKALPQKSSVPLDTQLVSQPNPSPKSADAPKITLSNNAIKAVITGVLIVLFVVVVFLIYYPSVLPWNW